MFLYELPSYNMDYSFHLMQSTTQITNISPYSIKFKCKQFMNVLFPIKLSYFLRKLQSNTLTFLLHKGNNSLKMSQNGSSWNQIGNVQMANLK